ncbi:hypothetical protein D3C87_2071250 [compost metagenome]
MFGELSYPKIKRVHNDVNQDRRNDRTNERQPDKEVDNSPSLLRDSTSLWNSDQPPVKHITSVTERNDKALLR